MNIVSMSLRVKSEDRTQDPRSLFSHIKVRIDGREYETRVVENTLHPLAPANYAMRQMKRQLMAEIERQLFEGI